MAQRRAFRRIPPERMRAEDFLASDPEAPDRTYTMEAALIEGYSFDRERFRVAGLAFRSADLVHWLALDVASRALEDAGFPDGRGLPRQSTGVLLGNTLTGEFSRANLMRLRWPYVRRVVDAALADAGWSAEKRGVFLADLEGRYKTPFPPVNEETLAGGLSNTIAGRICNHFDFQGGGYTLDGACSSSLLAVAHACSALSTSELDIALAGGVDLSLDPFEIVGFAKTEALAQEAMRVYDARASGFWPGEGCGFVVLMRHEDAVAQGVSPVAVLRGWGISSDGSGGLTRPRPEGQLLALKRAYGRAGFGIETVGFFEGHGTGTTEGDTVELRTLSTAIRETSVQVPPVAIGSVKANIGHTKAAAGVAGLIKATLALKAQVLPPATGCEEPHPELTSPDPVLRVLKEGECWPQDRPLRAGVSGMGFGGINVHLALERVTAERRQNLDARTSTLLGSAQDAELFVLSAGDIPALKRQVEHALTLAPRLSRSEVTDLAACLASRLEARRVRAAVVASEPAELASRLETLRDWISRGVTARLDTSLGVFLGEGDSRPCVVYLFPGQGSPSHVSGGAFRRRFGSVREIYGRARLPASGDGVDTSVAQPAIVTASLAGLRVLERLGITASTAVGHSLGELTAYHWAGAMDEETCLRIAVARGRIMAETARAGGAMAVLQAGAPEVEALIGEEEVVIAGLNGPRRTVISGEAAGVDAVITRARNRGHAATRLPVSHAFHSRLVATAEKPLAEHCIQEAFRPLERTVVSTVTGTPLAAGENLPYLLCRQVTSPVRFAEALTRAAGRADFFIEVGPGEVLSHLASGQVDAPVVSLDAGGYSLRGLLVAAGAVYCLGAPVLTEALFSDRFSRPFDLEWRPRFFENPCERAPVSDVKELRIPPEPGAIPAGPVPTVETDALGLFRQLVADRAELPLSAVKEGSRLLEDLHLNSITVGRLVSEAAHRLGLPPPMALTEYSSATVIQVARALESLADTQVSPRSERPDLEPPGVDTWIRTFKVDLVERPLPRRTPGANRTSWRVMAPADHPLAVRLQQEVKHWADGGCVLCLPPELNPSHLDLLLDGARAVPGPEGIGRFVVVQQDGGVAPFARTLHQEAPEVTTVVVNVPLHHPRATEWVKAEVEAAAGGYTEAHYDGDGRRRVPVLRLLPPGDRTVGLPLGHEDVLLVTGGGKGIAAECALALAQVTGVRLVLLGRSDPESDPELASNLDRMAKLGLRFHHVAADVTDTDAVREAVTRGEKALGRITGILHGAGINVPKSIRSLDRSDFIRTRAPKVQGAQNVLAAVDVERLKLFLAFGSIIARIGLPGEADYAVANDELRRLTERLQAAHPSCRCLCVEWSVWSGVGMGERLGRVDVLAREGITPITPDEGISILRDLLAHPFPGASVVVTGRFGRPRTLQVEAPDLPLWRFLEETRVHYPGVELVVDAVVSGDTDPYLEDHVFQGERILPAVLGLEAMAQAAMALNNTTSPPEFETVRFDHPVAIRAGKSVTLRAAAFAESDGRVRVVLRSGETDFQVDLVRATCRFRTEPDRGCGQKAPVEAEELPDVPMAPDRDLYGKLFFQGRRFQCLRGYRRLKARACVAEVVPDGKVQWFGRYVPDALVLGDPGARDAAIHAIQACIPGAALLPVGVDRLVPGVSTDPGSWTVRARERSAGEDTLTYDVEVVGSDGRVRERWEGLRLRKMGSAVPGDPWVAPLLGPYIERRLEDLITGSTVAVVVDRCGKGERNERTEIAVQRVVEKPVPVLRRPDGKPEVANGPEVSASVAGDVTLAVAGPGPVGCDVEPVVDRTDLDWQALLGVERHALAGIIAREAGEAAAAASTRVWAASECLKKAGARIDAPLVLVSSSSDGWVVLKAGRLRTATLVVRVQGIEAPLVFAVLARCDDEVL